MVAGLAVGRRKLRCLAAESLAMAGGWFWEAVVAPPLVLARLQPAPLNPCHAGTHRSWGKWGCRSAPRGETEARHVAWGRGVWGLPYSPVTPPAEPTAGAGAVLGCWAVCVSMCVSMCVNACV